MEMAVEYYRVGWKRTIEGPCRSLPSPRLYPEAACMGMGARAATPVARSAAAGNKHVHGRRCGKGKQNHPLQMNEEHHDPRL